jgi:hypothetical protein
VSGRNKLFALMTTNAIVRYKKKCLMRNFRSYEDILAEEIELEYSSKR